MTPGNIDTRDVQAAGAVLMVRPGVFYGNPETATSNAFQQPGGHADPALLAAALHEFDAAAARLARAGVEVLVAPAPRGDLPDALFPNNWFSTHADGTLAFYPMHSARRRAERQPDALQALLRSHGFGIDRVVDLSTLEASDRIVEGTGSLVLDRVTRQAWACHSVRTHPEAVAMACEALGYTPQLFTALDARGQPIYHTNVVLAVGSRLAVTCADAVPAPGERETLLQALSTATRRTLLLRLEQLDEFAANVLELAGRHGPCLAISARAWDSLDAAQRRCIEAEVEPVVVDVGTIERVGGGGIRCMLAEVHLPRRPAAPR